jgi:hypothetical protein
MKSKPLKSERDKIKKAEVPVPKKKKQSPKNPEIIAEVYKSPSYKSPSPQKKKISAIIGTMSAFTPNNVTKTTEKVDPIKTPIIKQLYSQYADQATAIKPLAQSEFKKLVNQEDAEMVCEEKKKPELQQQYYENFYYPHFVHSNHE